MTGKFHRKNLALFLSTIIDNHDALITVAVTMEGPVLYKLNVHIAARHI